MTDPCNKEDLDCRIWEANKELDRLIANVPAQLRDVPGLEGEWSLKDVLIHMAYWHNSICNRIEAALNNEPVPHESGEFSEINGRAVQAMRAECFDSVYLALKASSDRLEGILQSLSHEELFDPGVFPGITTKPLWETVDSETAGHYDEHLPRLREWMQEHKLPV